MPLSPVTLLMADDDLEDCHLTGMALRHAIDDVDLRFVHDGAELMAYLRRSGSDADAPFPGMILLDLNMPRLSGLQALAEIKADPALRRVPVVVFTTSQAPEDVERSYDLGASAFVTKPMSFGGLTESCRTLSDFYLHIAALPPTALPPPALPPIT